MFAEISHEAMKKVSRKAWNERPRGCVTFYQDLWHVEWPGRLACVRQDPPGQVEPDTFVWENGRWVRGTFQLGEG